MRAARLLACAAQALASASCAFDRPAEVAGDADPYRTLVEVPTTINRSLDLLFVVDDSPSMADKQNNLAANLPTLIDILNTTVPGGMPDLHIGVITTDMGTHASNGVTGPAIGTPGQGGCVSRGKGGNLQTFQAPLAGNFVSDIKQPDGTRLTNYTGDLATVLATMVRAGSGGCGFEQPLAAMRAALDNNAANADFVRPHALLAVVFLSDEDDCSIKDPAILGPESPALGKALSFRCTRFGVTCAQGGATPDDMNVAGTKSGCTSNPNSPYIDDVTPYAEFLRGLKVEARQLVVAGLIGATTPVTVEVTSQADGGTAPTLAHSCSYTGATNVEYADPPVRIASLLAQLAPDVAPGSLCKADLSSELSDLGLRISRAAGTSCLATDIAVDLTDCIVEDIASGVVTTIPACTNQGHPCWELVPDVASCIQGDHLSLHVQRDETPPVDTITRMRCRVQ